MMRFRVFLFFFCILVFFAEESSYSQKARVTIKLRNVDLETVLNEIENQTDYLFLYNSNQIDLSKKVSVNVKNIQVKDLLTSLFSGLPIHPVMEGTHIILLAIEKETPIDPMPVAQQTFAITGKVTNDSGEPIPGVNIVVKGTMIGIVTNQEGEYSVTAPNANVTLSFSFIGYMTREIPVDNRRVINVVLTEVFQALEEVIVVGYGLQRKNDVTGSVISVKGIELNALPTMRPDAALQGHAAGVMIQNTDGAPGGNVVIRIRGGNSISGGNNALVVVDGLQGVDISTINPDDIESMEILKDASATAIYGARGANGVILITTRRGSIGTPVIKYDYSIGFQKLIKKTDLLNAADYARKSNDYRSYQDTRTVGGVVEKIDPVLPFSLTDIAALEKNGGTDWQDELFKVGILQRHQLSITGGNKSIKYFASAGYLDQEGIMINSKYRRFNLRSNVDVTITPWLNAGINLNLMKAQGNVPPYGEGTGSADILSQAINAVLRFDPCTPVYNDVTGEYNFKANSPPVANASPYAHTDIWNPVATAVETMNDKNQFRQEANLFFDFKILKGLTFRVSGAVAISNEDELRFLSKKTQWGFGTGGWGRTFSSNSQYFQNSNILTYNEIFGNHRLTVTGVAEQQLSLFKELLVEAQGFSSDKTGIKDLASASVINTRTNNYSKRALNSWLSRVNYTFKDRYMFTASIRADGSSVFGDDNKWGYFPSVAVAWNMAEEDFLKNVKDISLLKLRVTWGETGNQAIEAFQTLATISSAGAYPYTGTTRLPGYRLARLPNPGLKWETTAQTNLGIDFGFFRQRLTFSVDVYKKTTKDLLLEKAMPGYTGFSTALYNTGSIENKGLEVVVASTPVVTQDFKWTSEINFSLNRDKVLSLASDLPLHVRTSIGGGYGVFLAGNYALKQLVVGNPVENMYGFKYLGVWKEDEREEAFKYRQMPGDPKYLDVPVKDGKPNTKGEIDYQIRRLEDGQQVIGNASPKFFYGWNNHLTYKWLNLSFLIQGSYGNDIFNATRIQIEHTQWGTSARLKNRWTPANQNTDIPGYVSAYDRYYTLRNATGGGVNADGNTSSRWVEDGSYIRLKNVTLTFTMPQSLINASPIDRLSVYLSVVNAITITKYSGYDPEVSSFNRLSSGSFGIDISNYPTARTYSIGVNITF